MTKIELLAVIEEKNTELKALKTELDKLEKYKHYEDMANEFGALKQAFMNSGFSDDQAFKLIESMIGPAVTQVFKDMRF